MKIIVGRTAGFCYGVKRAVEGAKEEVKKNNKSIFCLGEIVHNKQVVEELKNEGIIFVEEIDQAKGKTIIRAHGVPKEEYEKAKKMNINIIDYTCPNVLKIHEIANEYSKKGYYIFLCGNEKHPENIGTISYCGNNFSIIEKEDDVYKALKNLKKSKLEKLLLISQTTYSLEKFRIIEEIIGNELDKNTKLVVKNTICKATEFRQKETEEISKNVDCMIIIGGTNSSNTKKLYEIANRNCKNCICIETVGDLDLVELKKYDKIGIMAGASTPKKSIEEVKLKGESIFVSL
ncbi:MAG: 4-hydroxy-3-methylbut-2-enyl diphosphate reductase [Clostridia bacterium]|nr:4-hydroxy-3-methylbut-2-enyl diphosphate reductase [Clostridia bacterium]